MFIFRDLSSMTFHNFDAASLHDLELKVVDFTFGRSSIEVPLTIIRSHKLAGAASLVSWRYDDRKSCELLEFLKVSTV